MEGILKQIIAETFPNLGKETGIKIQEAQRTTLKINKNRSTPWHKIVKFTNLRDKENPESSSEQEVLTYNRNIRLEADISTETWQARKDWHDIFSVLNGKNMQPRILYPARLSFKTGAIKSFQDKQKLKEFLNTKPALQEILKGILWAKREPQSNKDQKGTERQSIETVTLQVIQWH